MAWRQRKAKRFFFEKKNQKTFAPVEYTVPQRVPPMSKNFCFLFQKEALSS
jgi:hypothetical protein